MDPIELSNYAGLAAIGLLTVNILLGLLLAHKYNPVRDWPHRRVNTVRVHNYVGYTALALSLVHPALLLLPSRVPFDLVDILYPVDAPKQPWINTLGAAALYLLAFVVITSYFRFRIGRKWWKRMHFTTYALFPLYAIHSILTDPTLRDHPIDPIDGEKVFIELCVLLVVVAVGARVRWQLRQPPPRQHRAKMPRARRVA
ncbi:MAG TPA: ferric reductase-like transmembrane domain-containing protein [Gemmatimonadaceae bacterium]